MSIIGIMPVLIAIDGFKSSLFYAALLFLSITVTAIFLFCLKNVEFRLKFPAAIIFVIPFNYFAYLFFKLTANCLIHSTKDNKEVLPPAAEIFTVKVRSVAKRAK